MKIKKGAEQSDWPLYDAMLAYNQKFDPDNLASLEAQAPCTYRITGSSRFSKHGKKNKNKNDDENENEFHCKFKFVSHVFFIAC